MASEGLEYNEVSLLVRGALNSGRLKLHKSGAVFKASKTGRVDQFSKDDIESAHWLRVACGQELKIVLKSGLQFRFDGFKESDFANLSEFLKSFFGVKLEEMELSVKGWNWGTATFNGSALAFEVDKKPAFEIPLKDVSQATTAGNNEVTLEFHQHDDAEVALMEMRFYIPTPADSTDPNPVTTFHEHVLSKADIIQITGDAIVTIPDVACLTPRGRYTMKIFPTFVQLHGKTYDYKIPYTTILRIFLLPHKDHMFFVVSMDPPIKQGQTRYPFLITRFDKDEHFDVKLNISEEEMKEKYDGKIEKEMSGAIYEIISRLMKAVVGKKITVPGTFKSHQGVSCITCSHRAGSGLLYPLERGFIFIHKPPVHVRFDEISAVNFARVAGAGGHSRSFDFELQTKNGTTIVFSSIEREEYGRLFDFVRDKKLRIKNTGKATTKSTKEKNIDDDLMGSDDDEHDAYLETVKAEAAARDEDDDESEDEDSDDESFAPEGSGDDQDVREEFESEPSSSEASGSDSEGESKKKKKEKPEKKRKAEKPPKSPKKKAKTASFVETGEKGKKGGKKKKDPNAPKRAMSAYMLWLNDTRQEIKDKNPGISVTEVSKVAGEMWKNLTDKSKWEEKAAIEKQKYVQRMKEYNENKKNDEEESPKKKSPSKKASKAPKEEKSPSPRKSLDNNQKFKSAEFVESSGDSSDSEAEKKKGKGKKSASKSKKKKEESSEDESMEEESEEEMSEGASDSD
ncbi:FACT complex subunit SSRP1 isoform X2 [Nematostella vectensis]|uniref:FACT complex subunit SSRP1 isoform X2 n=1 Tax=Nematostella vectensis TaxID=45351 RepID=UPI0020775033|nr:FACT complex subunit SSRP1 isoform X2 [Nematostella vectensis]